MKLLLKNITLLLLLLVTIFSINQNLNTKSPCAFSDYSHYYQQIISDDSSSSDLNFDGVGRFSYDIVQPTHVSSVPAVRSTVGERFPFKNLFSKLSVGRNIFNVTYHYVLVQHKLWKSYQKHVGYYLYQLCKIVI